jgi:hypothetical protein
MNQILPDGLLRMHRQDLSALGLSHLVSGLDDDSDERGGDRQCGACTTLSGYTEWVCDSEPRLSLGWDWQLDGQSADGRVCRLGLPRTNVLLLDRDGQALPWNESLQVLANFIDGFDWNTSAFQAVCVRYSN